MKRNESTAEKIAENFVPVELRSLDSKKRLTLGEKVLKLVNTHTNADQFKIYYGEDGDILLRPMVSISGKEAWVYRNPEALKRIRQGLSEAAEGKIAKVKNLKKFADSL